MGLKTLKSTLPMLGSTVRVLDTKAGTTEMERGSSWVAKRERVAKRYNYMCAACGLLWLSWRDEIDHIVPREQGGSNDESNLQPLHKNPCHADKTRREAQARARGVGQ